MLTHSPSKPIFFSPYHLHLFLAGVLFLLGLTGWTKFQNAGEWLSRSDSPKKAEVIICLGSSDRIRKAAELYHLGYGNVVILTAKQTKNDLIKQGVPHSAIILASWPLTTYQEALAVAPLLKKGGYRTVLLISDPPHIRRVRWTFNHVFEKQPIRFEFVSSDLPLVRERWWEDKMSRFYVLSEITKFAYYRIVHGFFRIDQEPPWVIAFKRHYLNLLSACCL